jgi:uncharacterized protein
MLDISAIGHQLPTETVTNTTAVLGIRGTGKTNTAVVIVEEVVKEKQQPIIFDPLGVWFGAKSSKDGLEPGLPIVIFGGAHADLPLTVDMAEQIADILVDSRMPAILSIEFLSKTQQRQFCQRFCTRLYERKAAPDKRDPVLVIFDEASLFVPQTKFKGTAADSAEAVEDLVRRGRSRGLGVMLIDQRAASINKDVLTQLEVLISHKQTSPQDRAAIKEWVSAYGDADVQKTLDQTLATLVLGQAWIWSPALDMFEKVQIRQRETFDSSATPKLGDKPIEPKSWASVDLSQLRSMLEASVEKDEDEDPAKGKNGASTAKLERDLSEKVQEIDRLQTELATERGKIKTITSLLVQATESSVRTMAFMGKLCMDAGLEVPIVGDPLADTVAEFAPKAVVAETIEQPNRIEYKATPPAEDGELRINQSMQAILNTLAGFEAMNVEQPLKVQIALQCGVQPKQAGFVKNVGLLNKHGLISASSERLSLTEEGRKRAVKTEKLRTVQEMQQVWLDSVSPPQRKMLERVIAAGDPGILKRDLQIGTGQEKTSAGFVKNLGIIKKLRLVAVTRDKVYATDLLCPPAPVGKK